MSDELPTQTPVPTLLTSVLEGYSSWNDYWTTVRHQPWRTEPEISAQRQDELRARRATIMPDIHQGIYPFKDVTLTRADVEWLLATHEIGGLVGPVDWEDATQRHRKGLDLRGAILAQVDLTDLPLARLQGGLSGRDFDAASTNLATREMKLAWAAMHLEQAVLTDARLQGSALVAARMDGATLKRARLEAADMYGVFFAADTPADLSGCFLNEATEFRELHLANAQGVGPRLRRVHWGGAQLVGSDWEPVKRLADERDATMRHKDGKRTDRRGRIRDFGRAISAYQLLATTLRSQGFGEASDKFAYRAQRCERMKWRLQRKYLRYLGSLGLDLVSGYGYKPLRSFLTYAIVIIAFAAAYFALGLAGGHPLAWNEALVVSMTSFHGRGFFPAVFQPGDIPAAVAAAEAFVGLLIEIVLIATFTQRFFAR